MKLKLDAHLALFLASQPKKTQQTLKVKNKFTGELLAEVSSAGPEEIELAVQRAVAASEPMKALPTHARKSALRRAIDQFELLREDFASLLALEVGKPIRDARVEVDRFIDTFRIAEEECGRQNGEVFSLDRVPRAEGYWGMTKRVPVGPCLFISPFNFPLNLTAHKIAPALAVGCPFILKPASRTPLSALWIGDVLSKLDLPKGAFSILPCSRESADRLIADDRLSLLSFTGSPAVGWDMKSRAGKKKVVLELGGNAACIIDETADLEKALPRVVTGAFAQSGQSCISVQRILIHKDRYDQFKKRLLEAISQLKTGNPLDEATNVGPLIDESEAIRLEGWIQSACKRGGKLLAGGKREGAVLQPTLLENVPSDEAICQDEAFGPVAILESFSSFEEALAKTNASRFGLQAGVFTQDIGRAHLAWDKLEVGGVIINDIPSWRADQMPYGGVKDSGLGREGVRYAMDDMTEIRLLVIKN